MTSDFKILSSISTTDSADYDLIIEDEYDSLITRVVDSSCRDGKSRDVETAPLQSTVRILALVLTALCLLSVVYQSAQFISASNKPAPPLRVLIIDVDDRPMPPPGRLAFDEDISQWGYWVWAAMNHRVYAKHQGYDYIHFDANEVKPERANAWAKVYGVKKYLHKYDYVVFLDSDSVISNVSISLPAFLQKYVAGFMENPQLVFIAAVDEPSTSNGDIMNTGVMIFKHSAQDMVDFWWDALDIPFNYTTLPTDPRFSSHCAHRLTRGTDYKPYAYHWTWEQKLLNNHIACHPVHSNAILNIARDYLYGPNGIYASHITGYWNREWCKKHLMMYAMNAWLES